MKCFHHVDADGLLAGFWVHQRFPIMREEDFIPINYGMNIDWFNKFEKDEHVIIVDFSFEPEDMKCILDKTKNVIWIDHHKSAIEKYKDFGSDIPGLRYDGIAGCMLTYCYFFTMNDGRKPFDESMCISAPWMTKYVADYDIWKYEYGDETRYFKLGLDANGIPSPTSTTWDYMMNIDVVRKMIEEGRVCQKYRDSIAKIACDSDGFEYTISGHKMFCLCTADSITNSEWFGDKIKEYDAVCSFGYNGHSKVWTYSFYSEKIDVSEIASNYPNKISGGGHRGASGLQTKEFIFK